MPTGTRNRLAAEAGISSIRLGDLTVSYVPDGAVELKPRAWFPATTDAFWADRPEYLNAAGNLVASIGGLLVEHGDRALLIDAGVGPLAWPDDPARPIGVLRGGALPASLAALGRDPAAIEAVAITHLHVDHTGWLWPATGAPSPLAGAEVLVSGPEWEHRELSDTDPAALDGFAGRVRTVADGEEVFPGVRVRTTAGHTAGHTVYEITSGGRRLLAFGDALHSPVQIAHPEISAVFDHDGELAADVRRGLVAELAGPDTIGFGGHFADVQFGRVAPGAPAWLPEPR
ncbi:MBL fold metallo-hydrolase [Actinomadura verrucosospora]|uniref:Metallo-beta-lactamase n=1 Tax=Actinomadura verrucosospora TaxID=46165 RepID=A0A7D3ZHU1_ACTVE|nr:MBL fold metallo-hydrolase [Actinomadura verrucosospora]QKG24137.1 metallo-beta-lactamase [Actinomadura verrucosospora]